MTHVHVIGDVIISGGEDAEMPAGRECVRFSGLQQGRPISAFTTAPVTCMSTRFDNAKGSIEREGVFVQKTNFEH